MGVAIHKAGGDGLSRSIHDLSVGEVYLRSNFPGRADCQNPLFGNGHGSSLNPPDQITSDGATGKNFGSPGDHDIRPGL
jgi:hypothetical protein